MTDESSTRLIAVGDNCLDVYVDTQAMAVGGNALNVAVQWHRQGQKTRYFGAVGKDIEGDILLEEICNAGLHPDDVECLVGSTATTLLRENGGDRRFILEDLGIGDGYFPEPDRYCHLRRANWVHLGTNPSARLVRQMVDDALPFSIDISTQLETPDLKHVPLVFASGPENIDTPLEPVIKKLLQGGMQKLVVTCGKRGAVFAEDETRCFVPAIPIKVVDTCGAGDSFIASFIVEFCINGASPKEALERATAAAALTCKHKGGFPQKLRTVPEGILAKYTHVIKSDVETFPD